MKWIAEWKKKHALNKIYNGVYAGFTHMSDKEHYGEVEYWVTPVDPYNVTGDCEDFALACRVLCRAEGYESRLVFCKTENNQGHIVLSVDGYIFDNRQRHVTTADMLNYKWIAMSGFEKDNTWHTIAEVR